MKVFKLFSKKQAFHIKTKDDLEAVFQGKKRLCPWAKKISRTGLISGDSDYFLASYSSGDVIYDSKGEAVSDFLEDISVRGLVAGESEYYIGKTKEGYYIFQGRKKITEACASIWPEGLVDGKSEYYACQKYDGNYYIGHIENGLVAGPFPYLSARSGVLTGYNTSILVFERKHAELYNLNKKILRADHIEIDRNNVTIKSRNSYYTYSFSHLLKAYKKRASV